MTPKPLKKGCDAHIASSAGMRKTATGWTAARTTTATAPRSRPTALGISLRMAPSRRPELAPPVRATSLALWHRVRRGIAPPVWLTQHRQMWLSVFAPTHPWSQSTLNETACRLAARSALADGAALADCVFPASLSGRNSDEARVARWLKLGGRAVDFNSLAPSARIQQPFVDKWHLPTQNMLFRHLRQLWADDRPRTMVDLGCHAV